jgi:hypothetical protein
MIVGLIICNSPFGSFHVCKIFNKEYFQIDFCCSCKNSEFYQGCDEFGIKFEFHVSWLMSIHVRTWLFNGKCVLFLHRYDKH